MRIYLRDTNKELVDEWRKAFRGIGDFHISQGNIFDLPDIDAAATGGAIVSPANSFGFMDGGIDLRYSEHFGWDLEARLQDRIKYEFHGELPVGQATTVPTHDKKIPWLISAPTMRVPLYVSNTPNAYLAFRAALREAKNQCFGSIICPGLGTGVGLLGYENCARQMYYAYNQAMDPKFPKSIGEAKLNHTALL